MFQQIVESFINELSKDAAYERFYNDIPSNVFEAIVASNGGRFDKLMRFIFDGIRKGDCDGQTGLRLSQEYNNQQLSNDIRSAVKKNFDNGEYSTPAEMLEEIEYMKKNGVVTLRSIFESGFGVLYDDEKIKITYTTTYEANHHYYGRSRWCTASDRLGDMDGWLYFLDYIFGNAGYDEIEYDYNHGHLINQINDITRCLVQYIDKSGGKIIQMQVGNNGDVKVACDYQDEYYEIKDDINFTTIRKVLKNSAKGIVEKTKESFKAEYQYQKSKENSLKLKRQRKIEKALELVETINKEINDKINNVIRPAVERVSSSKLFWNPEFVRKVLIDTQQISNQGPEYDNIQEQESLLKENGYFLFQIANRLSSDGFYMLKFTPTIGALKAIRENNEVTDEFCVTQNGHYHICNSVMYSDVATEEQKEKCSVKITPCENVYVVIHAQNDYLPRIDKVLNVFILNGDSTHVNIISYPEYDRVVRIESTDGDSHAIKTYLYSLLKNKIIDISALNNEVFDFLKCSDGIMLMPDGFEATAILIDNEYFEKIGEYTVSTAWDYGEYKIMAKVLEDKNTHELYIYNLDLHKIIDLGFKYEGIDKLSFTLEYHQLAAKNNKALGRPIVFVYNTQTGEVKFMEKQSNVLSEENNFGYHAGDLGKSEHFVNFATSNRGTGHFGTGTYFVGDENQLSGYNYKDRPHHKIDFSPYKLVKIRSFDLGIQFHDALKYINNDAFKDYAYNGKIDEEKLKRKCQIIAVMLFNIEDFNDLFKKRDVVYKKAVELIKEYGDYFNENGGTIHGLAKSDRRTISTELISSFGYDGVDCRGVEGLDNTTFGSVIYDLNL